MNCSCCNKSYANAFHQAPRGWSGTGGGGRAKDFLGGAEVWEKGRWEGGFGKSRWEVGCGGDLGKAGGTANRSQWIYALVGGGSWIEVF